jgi:hypothetical protein
MGLTSQIELFHVDREGRPAAPGSWQAMPEDARARVRDLFATLVVEHLRATQEGSEGNERQHEDQANALEP